MATIHDLANQFRTDLLNQETAAARRMVAGYIRVNTVIERETAAILRQIDRDVQKGATVGPSLFFRQGRMEKFQRTVTDEMARFSAIASGQVTDTQSTAVGKVPDQTTALVRAALGDAPGQAVEGVLAGFATLPTNVLEEFVGRTSEGSPLRDLFSLLGIRTSQTLETELIGGLAVGYNPRRIARQVARTTAVGLNRALLISRTETINAYRGATRASYAENPDVLEGWVWHSALGPRTCPACWAMHGSKHSNEERLDGHPNCRCAMVPFTRSWEELGFTGLPDTRPVTPLGPDLFARASPDLQRRVLGTKAAFAAFQRGEVKLTDFLARKDDAAWGTTRYTRSLLAVKQGRGGFEFGEGAIGTFVAVPLQDVIRLATTPPAPSTVDLRRPAEVAREALITQDDADAVAFRALKDEEERLQLEYQTVFRQITQLDISDLPNARQEADRLEVELNRIKAEYHEAQRKAIDFQRNRQQALREAFLYVDDPAEFQVSWNITNRHKARKETEEGIAEFKRLVGRDVLGTGRTLKADPISGKKQRSFYTTGQDRISMGNTASRSVTLHELGHWVEDVNPQVLDKLLRFFDKRTAGEQWQSLRSLTGLKSYDRWEVAKPDRFHSPYVGKDYKGKATEILSMGLERYWGMPAQFARQDPEYFDLIWEVVRGDYS